MSEFDKVSDGPPSDIISLDTYYDKCPSYLIMDYSKNIYTFPANYTTNGTVNDDWDDGNALWGYCKKVYPYRLDKYVMPKSGVRTGTSSSNDNPNNIFRDSDFVTVNASNGSNYTIPGYKRASASTLNNNSYSSAKSSAGWVRLDPGTGYDYRFFLLFKKETDSTTFKNQIVNSIDGCRNGNQVYDYDNCKAWCSPTLQTDPAVHAVCNTGYAQNVLDHSDGGTNFSNITELNKYTIAKNMDGGITSSFAAWCSNNANNNICKDMRASGTTVSDVKKYLDTSLSKWCSLSDANFNDTYCNDPKTACKASGGFIDNTTVPNYNCYDLATSSTLSIVNKNSLVTPVQISTLPTAQQNIFYGNNFDKNLFTYECSNPLNKNDALCLKYLQQNYSSQITTSDSFPVLLMYFSGDINNANNTISPIGLDAEDNLNIVWGNPLSIKKITSVQNSGNSFTMPSTTTQWSAKMYTYIMPSNIDDYIFKVSADDNVKVYINNTLLINSWTSSAGSGIILPYSMRLDPSKGPYLLYCEFKDTGGDASFNLQYNTKTKLAANTANFLQFSSTVAGSGSTLYLQKFSPYVQLNNAKQTQSLAYCNTNNRFASDLYCIGTPAYNFLNGTNKQYPNPSINTYCNTNMDSDFCINSDNITIGNYSEPSNYSLEKSIASKLTNDRLTFQKNNVNTALAKTDNTKGTLLASTEDYIKTIYPKLQKNAGTSLYPDSNFVTSNVMNFCEISDSLLATNLCSSVYNTFSKNPDIISSKERIDDYNNCVVTNKFMTDPPSGDPNKPSCSDKRDNAKSFARYLPLAINYCGNNTVTTDPITKEVTTTPNIISNECQSYYNNIGTNITNTMSKNYSNPVAGSAERFTNKESFKGNCPYSDDDEDCNDCNDDNLFNSNIFIFFLFILFVLMLVSFTSNYTSYKTKYKSNEMNFNP